MRNGEARLHRHPERSRRIPLSYLRGSSTPLGMTVSAFIIVEHEQE
jgi:hypothetical protein